MGVHRPATNASVVCFSVRGGGAGYGGGAGCDAVGEVGGELGSEATGGSGDTTGAAMVGIGELGDGGCSRGDAEGGTDGLADGDVPSFAPDALESSISRIGAPVESMAANVTKLHIQRRRYGSVLTMECSDSSSSSTSASGARTRCHLVAVGCLASDLR